YKYFNAGTGAILAGSADVVAKVAQARKLFGGGLYHAWPYAAVALHYLDGFTERYQKAVGTARGLFARLEKDSRFRVEPIPNGSNIFKLHVRVADRKVYQASLKDRGVHVRAPGGDGPWLLFINESAGRRPADELARAFVEALPG